MATTETLNVQLADGGTITLTIEADFLAMRIEDFSLVKELAEMVRNVGGEPPTPEPTVVVPAPAKPTATPKATVAKKAAAPSRPGGSKYDLAEVARIANAAARAGEPMRRAVAQRFGVTEGNADQIIVKARSVGHEIARRSDKPSNVTPIAKQPAVKPVVHEGNRAFTPADTLQIIEGGSSVG